MSRVMLEFARSFVIGRLSADEFSSGFSELWRIERDGGLLQADEDKLSECLSSIFCLADIYNPNEDRAEYELDGERLREEVSSKIRAFFGS